MAIVAVVVALIGVTALTIRWGRRSASKHTKAPAPQPTTTPAKGSPNPLVPRGETPAGAGSAEGAAPSGTSSRLPPTTAVRVERSGASHLRVALPRAVGRYALIFAVDGRGMVSRLYPFEDGESVRVDAQSWLPGRIDLAGTQLPIRIVAFVTAKPVASQTFEQHLALRGSVDGLERDSLPADASIGRTRVGR